MVRLRSVALVAGLACTILPSYAQTTNPEVEANQAGQSVADAIRSATKADLAFVAAGHIRKTGKDSLASYIQYPNDEIVILELTGSQVKAALERSVSLLPQPNPSFLQLSGLEVTVTKSSAPGSRIGQVLVGNALLTLDQKYKVAMPLSLGRGGLGYFKVWDKSAIIDQLKGQTLESIVADKVVTDTSARWRISL